MPLVKYLHVGLAFTSFAGFIWRGAWLVMYSPQARPPWMRRLPHVVDTLLLATGVTMLVAYHIRPLHAPWLLAKLTALVGYIALGFLAYGNLITRPLRIGAGCAAVVVFGYILSVALTKRPFPL